MVEEEHLLELDEFVSDFLDFFSKWEAFWEILLLDLDQFHGNPFELMEYYEDLFNNDYDSNQDSSSGNESDDSEYTVDSSEDEQVEEAMSVTNYDDLGSIEDEYYEWMYNELISTTEEDPLMDMDVDVLSDEDFAMYDISSSEEELDEHCCTW